MVEKNLHAPVKLFYSYSHKDETHRENMGKSLAILEQDGLLYEWFDGKILPGENIYPKIKEEMDAGRYLYFSYQPGLHRLSSVQERMGVRKTIMR